MQRYLYPAMLLLQGAMASAEPQPRPDPITPEIREAIRDLDASAFRARTTAARRLLAAGKPAVTPLREAALTGSTEAADRAVKILAELAGAADAATAAAARDALRQLSDSKSPARDRAVEFLRGQRAKVLDLMQQKGRPLPV